MKKEVGTMDVFDAGSKLGSTVAPYVMESPREGARLEAKHDAVTTERHLRGTGLRRGMRVLEAGCGTGAVARTMAKIVAPGRVVGVDISSSRLAQARELAAADGLDVEFVEGDACRLPLPSATFDYSYCRFLFEYLPEPERALAELMRVTRPGGTVVVADLDGQLEQFYPLEPSVHSELLEGLWLMGRSGFDPRVGRKLYHWFCRAGFSDISVRVEPYQVYAGGLPGRDFANWRAKLTTAKEFLIEHTGERERWERSYGAFLAQLGRADVFYYCSLIIVRGTVPSEREEVRSGGIHCEPRS
jgi:ubiquinone/menaquinone biosynthesis C-methylase UbiE